MNPATLRTLIELARTRSDAAQLKHAGLVRSAGQARTHLEMLRQYAREYDDRARNRPGDSRDPGADRNQEAFLVRLQEAVEAQVRELDIRENAVSVAAAELSRCLQKRKSLEMLAQRRLDQSRRVEAKREQKRTDEFAQRAHERAAGYHQSENKSGSET